MRRKSISLFLLLVGFSAWGIAQQQMRTVFIVRHGERASSAPDSPLSAAGEKRAQCLAATLRDANIQNIFVTNYIRTQQTAAPLARELKKTSQIVGADDLDLLARKVLAASGNTVIVAHSDTMPSIVQKLGGGKIAALGSAEYDRMIEIILYPKLPARTLTLRYCECNGTEKPATDAGPMIRK